MMFVFGTFFGLFLAVGVVLIVGYALIQDRKDRGEDET